MTHRTSIAAALVACVLLAGCVRYNKPVSEIQGTEDDQFSREVTVNGAALIVNGAPGSIGRLWYIRSFVDKKTRAVTHQLYFEFSYDPPKSDYRFADDDTAKRLKVQKIDFRHSCTPAPCTDFETIGIWVDEKLLQERFYTGYKVKVSSQDGNSFVFEFEPKMIQLQLDQVVKVLASPAVAPAPPAPPEPPGPKLGVNATNLPPNHPAKLRDPNLQGVQMFYVTPGSPAALAGVVNGDVITDYDGKPVASVEELRAAIAAGGTGRGIAVGIAHWGQPGRFIAQVQM